MVHEGRKPWVPCNRVRMEWVDSKPPYRYRDRGRIDGLDTCFNGLIAVCIFIFPAAFAFTSLWRWKVAVLVQYPTV